MRAFKLDEVVRAIRLEFGRFGFRADNASLRDAKDSVMVEFEVEAATGQAAFSQTLVQAKARIWVAIATPKPHNEIDVSDRVPIDLKVSYEHPGGGTNGVDVQYFLESSFDKLSLRRKE